MIEGSRRGKRKSASLLDHQGSNASDSTQAILPACSVVASARPLRRSPEAGSTVRHLKFTTLIPKTGENDPYATEARQLRSSKVREPEALGKKPVSSKGAAAKAKRQKSELIAPAKSMCTRKSSSTKDSQPDLARQGKPLQRRIQAASRASSRVWLPGTQVWAKLRGSAAWPGAIWSYDLCQRRDAPQLLTSFVEGTVLVRFYGEHSSMWLKPEQLEQPSLDDEDKTSALRSWGRQHHKAKLVEAALSEMEGVESEPRAEVSRMLALQEAYLACPDAADCCDLCGENGAELTCPHCERLFHPICLQPPALTSADLPRQGSWSCPCCGETNQADELAEGDEEAERKLERMGLTPDWIIQAAAHGLFKLERPSEEQPYIKGLLDPCTNSKIAPNIPAEKLYDKQDNGLKLSNSWSGYHIILNPDFSANVQWRFVNRAIDEVENQRVPGVLLMVRNSTDTAYFQRLRPYPRILLRRLAARFKDYDKSPIGFGIVVFCIVKDNCREMYERFYEAFAQMGEPNIPIDKELMQSAEFYALLDRLRQHAEEHQRDHWIQCSLCAKWRIISYDTMVAARDDDWTCKQLRPPYTSCRTLQTKRETFGGRYAAGGADFTDPQGPVEAGTARSEERWQVLTGLELARQARIAANRAYLAGLKVGPEAMHDGRIKPLAPDDPLMLLAAKTMAQQAALKEASNQVEEAKRQWHWGSRARMRRRTELQAELVAMDEEDKAAKTLIEAAQAALQEVKLQQVVPGNVTTG
ncbi:hypothetical protein WJX84_009338 [Apatococcus fuscideae]|uniref:Uncharacterized protein n=1 Tax=Apatococcus fuscideae TaxID=2026836 RepID=A0AAW1TCD3_9CHLO